MTKCLRQSRVQKSANKQRDIERKKETNIQDLKKLGQKLYAKLRNGVCIKTLDLTNIRHDKG